MSIHKSNCEYSFHQIEKRPQVKYKLSYSGNVCDYKEVQIKIKITLS